MKRKVATHTQQGFDARPTAHHPCSPGMALGAADGGEHLETPLVLSLTPEHRAIEGGVEHVERRDLPDEDLVGDAIADGP